MNLNFFYCQTCGKIVAIVKNSSSQTVCCQKPMKHLVPNQMRTFLGEDSVNANMNCKNIVPIIKVNGRTVSVSLGTKISGQKKISSKQQLDWILIQSGVLNEKSKNLSFPQISTQQNVRENFDFAVMSGEKVEAEFSLR